MHAHLSTHACLHTQTHKHTNAVAFTRDGYESGHFCRVVVCLADKKHALFHKVNKNLA